MTSAMWKLKNAIFAEHDYVSWGDKKRFRWLSEGNEQQRKVIMEAVGYGHPLRSKAITCGHVDPETNYMQRCGIPLCPRCHMTERRKQIRYATRERFADASNEQLAFITILMPMATSLSDVSDIIGSEKTRIRNLVNIKRRKDHRWDSFELLGWWEIDRMIYSDYENMGRNSKLAVEQLGMPLVWFDDTTIWRPHLHAIVRLDHLSKEEVSDAFRKNGYGAAYQVLVKPLVAHRKVGDNIKDIIKYALKFRIEGEYKAPSGVVEAVSYDLANRKWWPLKDIMDYAEWLCNETSGFQSLRFSLGVKSKSSASGLSELGTAKLLRAEAQGSPLDAAAVDELNMAEHAAADDCEVDELSAYVDDFNEQYSARGIFNGLVVDDFMVKSSRYSCVRYNNLTQILTGSGCGNSLLSQRQPLPLRDRLISLHLLDSADERDLSCATMTIGRTRVRPQSSEVSDDGRKV